jgi:hypothetical protein
LSSARQSWCCCEVHVVASAISGISATATNFLLIVSVLVGFVSDTRIPRLVRIERTEAAAAAGCTGLLVSTCGGAVVAVLELSELIVEPTDDTSWCRLRGSVSVVFFMPW